MPKKKITAILNAIPLTNVSTGISRYLYCLYSEIEESFGHEIKVAYFHGSSVSSQIPRGPSDLSKWAAYVDFFWKLPTFVSFPARVAFHLYRELLFKRIAGGNDLYHEAAFFPFAKPQGVKTVFTLHDLSLHRFPQFHPRERVLFSRLFLKRRCRTVDHFMTDSEFIKKEMSLFLSIPSKKVSVVPLAHDSKIFYPRDQQQVENLKVRLSLPDRYFITVGSGDPRKNIHVIPKAIKKAKLDIPLLMAGWSGWSYKNHPDDLMISLGYVSDDDLARLYSGALALIYPSLYEGFGLPVLEAMACGCPVICSRNSSLPEVAGDAALYIEDPSDTHQLASLLQQAAGKPSLRKELSDQGKDRAANYSWQKTAKMTMEVFRKTVDE